MTNVDRKNTATYASIWISDNVKQISQMRKDYEAVGADAKDEKRFVVNSMDGYSIQAEEMYLDLDQEPEIRCSFTMQGAEGKADITFDVPLTDELLTDIIAYGIKKLNKLKTAMEALK